MSNLALATGSAGLIGIVSISLFYVVGGVFGPLNDVSNGVMAVLAAVMAWRIDLAFRTQAPRARRPALAAALAGAAIAVAGSALVISRTTGWYLAGLVTTFGYGLIGVWLEGVSRAAPVSLGWPRRVAQLGRLTGGLMALGLLAAAGMAARVDDAARAPWWAHAGLAGGLGWFLLFPIWCLWLGRRSAARDATRREAVKA